MFDGTAWGARVSSTSKLDVRPSIAVDANGVTHLVFARNSLDYSACSLPLCPSYPGLRSATGVTASDGFSPTRVTDLGEDVAPDVVRGADGSIAAAFLSDGIRVGEIRLQVALPSVSGVATHLAGSGTVTQGRAMVTLTFSGAHATAYRAQQSVNGGAYATVGSVDATTSRMYGLTPSTSTTRKFRVGGINGAGMTGPYVAAAVFRVWTKNESPASSLVYSGTWGSASSSSYYGGALRFASSSTARATLTFTGREIAWIAAKGPTRGTARVYVDGVLAATVNLHASSTAYRQIAYRKTGLALGTHTLQIRVVGDGRVDVDGFEILK
jgi:hypothetical protein